MKTVPATIFIIDDDPSVRSSLQRLLKTTDYLVRTFETGQELLDHGRPAGPAAAVVDLHLPDINGLELQKQLDQMGIRVPLVFLTGYGSVESAVGAMKDGAVDFLSKPVDSEKLLNALDRAISRDIALLATMRREKEARGLIDSLTGREAEVQIAGSQRS